MKKFVIVFIFVLLICMNASAEEIEYEEDFSLVSVIEQEDELYWMWSFEMNGHMRWIFINLDTEDVYSVSNNSDYTVIFLGNEAWRFW